MKNAQPAKKPIPFDYYHIVKNMKVDPTEYREDREHHNHSAIDCTLTPNTALKVLDDMIRLLSIEANTRRGI